MHIAQTIINIKIWAVQTIRVLTVSIMISIRALVERTKSIDIFV